MEEKEIEIKDKNIDIELPKGFVEDNNLKIFLDDTVDLGEVISEIKTDEIDTNEMNINE